ncbi:MAG TPA: adenosylcobalamin-dependent ribonucleoside-diphosphate reductase [Candidatus Binatia bacterium]|jgi:ribonucleoside-diphosphate reductase alpha chain|nr:adenosylcobalamin-dependent ribonucleoside-diphosphate reductase [Candidatus Binatia bacterium]
MGPPFGEAPSLGADALRVLEARYLRRDDTGRVIESPAELFARVARGVAEGELLTGTARAAARWEERFHALLATLDFLPNSPVLMNAGTPLGQLAACFVVPVGDSMEEIFDALRAMALVQRTGGGTGFSFSRLRPRGEVVASTGGSASGPVSFMRVFDAATEHIKQGGRRRGANMAVLRVDHPDVLEFVESKRDGTSLQNFNLSVGVTDRFMAAVVADARCELVHPGRGTATASLRAREVFDRIVEAAWATGDPGLVFLDAVERANPTPALGEIETTNPCGEVPLLPWESCVLGSVNLAHMIATEGGSTTVDWRRLARTVRAAVRFLDDVIEVSREPLAEIGRATRRTRKIGVGVMGFAELLVRLGVSYGERAAVAWADRLSAFVAQEARVASRELAEERGVFPAWGRSAHAARGERLRNATLLSVAPTGTISIVAGTSGGIEPLFALAYRRAHTLGGAPFAELNPVFRAWLESQGLDAAPLLAGVVAEGHLGRVAGAPAAARALFVTATELPPSQHLAVQAAVQRHVDNAVSKTVNLPEEARPDEVAATYLEAWRLGLKGVTIYRAGSRDQVFELGMGERAIGRELFARCDPDACRL